MRRSYDERLSFLPRQVYSPLQRYAGWLSLQVDALRVMLVVEAGMVLHDLIPTLQSLTRADKLQAIQVLLSELAKEEGILLISGAEYPVWSPINATEAGDTLLKMLDGHASR